MEGGGGLWCEVSANEYSCAHKEQINFRDLTPYLTYALARSYPIYSLLTSRKVRIVLVKWIATKSYDSAYAQIFWALGKTILEENSKGKGANKFPKPRKSAVTCFGKKDLNFYSLTGRLAWLRGSSPLSHLLPTEPRLLQQYQLRQVPRPSFGAQVPATTTPTTSSTQTFIWSSGTCYNNTNYVKYPDLHLELRYLLQQCQLLQVPRPSPGAQVPATTIPTKSSTQTFTWNSGTCYNNTNYIKYPDLHLELR